MEFNADLVSQNITKYREQNGLNQREFADKIGLSPGSISQIECGRECASINTLLKISETFDISVDQLLDGVLAFNSNDIKFDVDKEGLDTLLKEIKLATVTQKTAILEILKCYVEKMKKDKGE